VYIHMSALQLIKKINTLTITDPKFGSKKGVIKKFSQSVVKIEKKPLRLKITGDLFMMPNRNESEDYGLKYSIGVEFQESECELFDAILDKLEIDGWERKECHDEGKIFLTLKANAGSTDFTCTSNVPIKPLKLTSDKLDLGMEVTVDLAVAGWYMQDEDEKKYGLTLKVKGLFFGPQPIKRKRKDDDEVMERKR
jgi:hypothetical protein